MLTAYLETRQRIRSMNHEVLFWARYFVLLEEALREVGYVSFCLPERFGRGMDSVDSMVRG